MLKFEAYLTKYGPHMKRKKFLGGGTDGEVFSTNRETAVKVFMKPRNYFNEKDTYLHLKQFGVTDRISGFWIPKLIRYDDEIMAVEMEMMQKPPFIIDFGKVRLFSPPDYSEQTMEYANHEGEERFGENWPQVQVLLEALESYQIYYLDPSPSNIVFSIENEGA